MFKTIDDIKNFQKKLRPSNDTFIYYYFNTIYQNLLIREETPKADINEFNNKNLFSNTQKQKANEKGISFRNFLQYFDIQEFMCDRIFNYLDKSKTGKLSKNEFVNGLCTIFFGNIPDLYKMVFYICDFNQNNKIHKFNMKLILSYIPVKTYEEQQEYIKKINTIMHNYFSYLDKEYPEKKIKTDKELDYDLYESSIKEYINDVDKQNSDNFNNNGSFLTFINIISYIYMNHPFITENMNYCNFLKNKFLMKIPQNKNRLPTLERNNIYRFGSTLTNLDSSPSKCNTQRSNNNNNNNINNNIGEIIPKATDKNRSNSFHNSKIVKKKGVAKNEKNDKQIKNQLSKN